MIVFDSGFEIEVVNGGTDVLFAIPLKNGKFYLSEGCYNENKVQVDDLGITFQTREILESEYVK